MLALECKDLSKTFRSGRSLFRPAREVSAVSDVSLSVGRGEVLGIVGESGSGKSTLLKMICGSLAPDRGSVDFDGRDSFKMSRLERARVVQTVQQDPFSSLNPRRTILGNITLPLRAQGQLSAADSRTLALSLMDRVGLASRFAEAYPQQLSGGQRQRVAIARALIGKPLTVVCDEPTSALDASVQAQVLNLLSDLQTEFNLSMILVTHDLSVVRYLSHRVLVMYKGRAVETASVDDIFSNPQHEYTQRLLGAMLTV